MGGVPPEARLGNHDSPRSATASSHGSPSTPISGPRPHLEPARSAAHARHPG